MKIFLTLISLFTFGTVYAADSVSVTSFNIRYNNPDDGDYRWDSRRDRLVQKVLLDGSDVVGFQEVLSDQMDFLREKLPSYGSVGVGRDDGKRAGEYAPIFYRKDLFGVAVSGHRWLSPTPDRASIGWDAACIRIATWAVLQGLEGGDRLLVINTHFDHVGHIARRKSSEIVVALADSLARVYRSPVVLMGDFNSPTSDSDLAVIVNNFDNAQCNCAVPEYTYIGWPGGTDAPSVIDHIFTRGLKTRGYRVDNQNYGLGQLSDHRSVHIIVK